MEFNSTTTRWIVASLLVIASPIISIPFFFLVMVIVSAIPVPESLDLWLEAAPFRPAIGTALVTAVFSIESMLKSFYITLPLLLGSALGLQSLIDGFQAMPKRILVSIVGMGILYVVLYFSGVYFGWLEEVFYT